jgi:hypothetical protein
MFSPRDLLAKRQKVITGTEVATVALSVSITVDVIKFGTPVSKISYQATGDLAGTIEFTIDGVDFFGSSALPAMNAPATYTAHAVTAVRITRTSGSGKLYIAAV